MIDFRYHVVSLVSVFIALAVGIVLGAGPLNEGISTGITDQVRQLTTEKNQLRTERDAARTELDQQDAWAEAVGPALVARQLGGRGVAIVELPGADSSQVDATVAVLQAAGAQVSAQVTLQDEWIDTTSTATADRQKAADALTGQLTTAPAADAGTQDLLAAELARAVVTLEMVPSGAPDDGARTVLTTLSDAGLLDVQGGANTAVTRGTLALVVGGTPDADATDAQRKAASTAWNAVARELDAASAGVVVAGPTGSAADGGVVADLRADSDLTEDVSSVDDLDSSMGRVNVVLALRQQLSGASGQYGTADSATAVNPPLPAAAS